MGRQVLIIKKSIFQIKKNAVHRYYFVFKTTEEKIIATSKSFSSRSELEICIAGIRDYAKIADLKEENENIKALPVFKILNNEKGYSFNLISMENEIIFTSDNYINKEQCKEAISLIKENVYDANILDSTED